MNTLLENLRKEIESFFNALISKAQDELSELDKEIKKLTDSRNALDELTAALIVLKNKYIGQLGPGPSAESVIFYLLIGSKKVKVDHMQLKVTAKLPVSVEFKDKFGNAAKVDGAPKWDVTDPSLGAIVASEDGLSAEFTPAGIVGSLKLQVSADADLGTGIQTIAGELSIDLLPGDAEIVEIKAGEVL